MCGIGGIVKMGKRPIGLHQVQLLMNGLEYRGNDATGLALMYESGDTTWLKHHDPAWKFTASRDFQDWAKERFTPDVKIAIVHTRKATKGTPFNNDNNHPITSGQGIIVHNGMIRIPMPSERFWMSTGR
jgi:glucosamine 6-phosphate synthetase-like amidotransferase/phosphosugar isomerase protein